MCYKGTAYKTKFSWLLRVSTYRRILVLVQVVPDVREVHGPFDVLEVSGGSIALLEHDVERVAPTGPLHCH